MSYWYGSKRTADRCKALDINLLNRKGYLRAGNWSTMSWSRGGKTTGSINLQASPGCVILHYQSQWREEEWESVEERVNLTWTRCNYGGARPWFVCPGIGCGRRVGKLYGPGKYFLCRHCYDLAYQSQRDSAADRWMSKAQDIRQRLGGSVSLYHVFPWKPKGMHWTTYERLWHEARAAEQRVLISMNRWMEKVERRLRFKP